MKRKVDITEVQFLSQTRVLLRFHDPQKRSQAMCDLPWFVRMVHWLVDSGLTRPPAWSKSGHDWEFRMPVDVDVTTGSIVEDVRIRTEEDFPLRDVLTVWTVMED